MVLVEWIRKQSNDRTESARAFNTFDVSPKSVKRERTNIAIKADRKSLSTYSVKFTNNTNSIEGDFLSSPCQSLHIANIQKSLSLDFRCESEYFQLILTYSPSHIPILYRFCVFFIAHASSNVNRKKGKNL